MDIKKKALKFILLLLPVASVFMACGCSSSKEEIVTAIPDGPYDPMGYIREDEAFISEYRGFYLVRDDVYYSLNDITSIKDKDEYNLGKKFGYDEYETLYEREGALDHFYMWLYGDFDLPVISDTDEVRSYGVSQVDLWKLEDIKYGFVRQMSGMDHGVYSGYVDTTEGRKRIHSAYKEYKCMCGDEEIDVNYNLEKGTEVTVSWYEGTDYFEYTAIADTKFYRTYDKSPDYEIEGELCKESYAKYDFSGVEPGLYLLLSTEINSTNGFGEKQLKGGSIIIIE